MKTEKKHKHLLVIGRAFEGEDFCYAYKNLTATQAIKEFNKEVQDLYGKGRSSIIEAVLASSSTIKLVASDTMSP